MADEGPAVLVPRHAQAIVVEALAAARVVLVMGARQTGKSTLTREVVGTIRPTTIFTLDELITRDNAADDPVGFLAAASGLVLIDEVQRVPDLLYAIKLRVDQDRRPGQFLLTGSANILTAPRVYEALTGRVDLVQLWPLAQSEIERSRTNLVDSLFIGEPPNIHGAPINRVAFVERAAVGGFPEVQGLTSRQRERWFVSYVTTTLDRDLRDIADVRRLDEMPRLLRVLATQSAGIFNSRGLASSLEISHLTVAEYARLLETMFLVRIVPAWRPGLRSRERHAPKIYVADTGLLAHLLRADERRIAEDDQVSGPMFETLVAMEVAKHLGWADEIGIRQLHWRDDRDEVDIVLERRDGAIVAIEAKASATVRPSDTVGLRKLRDLSGNRFVAGVVIYTGERTHPLGDRLWAVPVSGLWSG